MSNQKPTRRKPRRQHPWRHQRISDFTTAFPVRYCKGCGKRVVYFVHNDTTQAQRLVDPSKKFADMELHSVEACCRQHNLLVGFPEVQDPTKDEA